ncbi:MAG: HAD family phosphatase [Alistipes sp.]|nr:HAD family phosphatase [Alistipes sp.]
MEFKGIIFDMDGVLVDSMPSHAEKLKVLCERYNSQHWDGDVGQFAGWGPEAVFEVLLPEQLAQRGAESLNAESEEIFREIFAPKVKLMPGLEHFLDGVKHHGIKCSIGSSGCRENVALTWEKCDLERWFEASVCANDVTYCKPSPEIFLTAAKRLGLHPEECIVFEDAISGIEAAKAAGMKVVTLTTTLPRESLEAAGADLVVDSFDEVDYGVLSKL